MDGTGVNGLRLKSRSSVGYQEGSAGRLRATRDRQEIHGHHISYLFGENEEKRSSMTILHGWAPIMVTLDLRHVEIAQVLRRSERHGGGSGVKHGMGFQPLTKPMMGGLFLLY